MEELGEWAGRFQSCTLAKAEWTHEMHLRIGAWHVRRFGADEAIRRLRQGIRRLNDSHGTPNSDSRGYHETITIAYVRLISAFLEREPVGQPISASAERLLRNELAGQPGFPAALLFPGVIDVDRGARRLDRTGYRAVMNELRIVRASERQVTPWKNGKGWTAEIAIEPLNATLESFDWRISVAGTEVSAPFSTFNGVDRTLAVLEGRIVLSVDDRLPVEMNAGSLPVAFPGDAATSARLLESPLKDLNVMTRRGRFTHVMERRTLDLPMEIRAPGNITVVLPLGDGFSLGLGTQRELLQPGDAAIIGRTEKPLSLFPGTGGDVFLIRVNET